MRGFTLIEMLVVMSIFVVLTTLTIASNANYGVKIALEGLAYDISFSIRQAQVYGIAVQRFGNTADFSRAYGIHFDRSTPNSYQLFADVLEGNGLYDCPDPEDPITCELVESTTIRGGYIISDLCVRASGSGIETCGIDTLNILFRRPEPDAYIRTDVETPIYELGRIVLESPRLDHKDVVVEFSGQISVQ